jgi:hypothetical protein
MRARNVARRVIDLALKLPSDQAREFFDLLDAIAQLTPAETEMLRCSEFQHNVAQHYKAERLH